MNNFFQSLFPMLEGLDSLQMVFSKKDDNLLITVLPKARNVKDKAVGRIAPLLFNGTPAELDQQFLEQIQKPIESTTGFFVSLKNFEDSVEEARKQSDMEKKKKDEQRKAQESEKKEIESNDKKVNEAIAEADSEKKDKPEPALRKLEDLQKKNYKLSAKVKQALEAKIEELKSIQPQKSLFGNK